jgi:hypothetical protein
VTEAGSLVARTGYRLGWLMSGIRVCGTTIVGRQNLGHKSALVRGVVNREECDWRGSLVVGFVE